MLGSFSLPSVTDKMGLGQISDSLDNSELRDTLTLN